MPLVTITAAAESLGLNKSTVSRQAREWALVRPDGLIELDRYTTERSARLSASPVTRPVAEWVSLAALWPHVHQLRDELLSEARSAIPNPVQAQCLEARISAALAAFVAKVASGEMSGGVSPE